MQKKAQEDSLSLQRLKAKIAARNRKVMTPSKMKRLKDAKLMK